MWNGKSCLHLYVFFMVYGFAALTSHWHHCDVRGTTIIESFYANMEISDVWRSLFVKSATQIWAVLAMDSFSVVCGRCGLHLSLIWRNCSFCITTPLFHKQGQKWPQRLIWILAFQCRNCFVAIFADYFNHVRIPGKLKKGLIHVCLLFCVLTQINCGWVSLKRRYTVLKIA